MRILVIDRNEWRRGNLAGKNETSENSKLLCPETHTKCCLGFLALDCGYSKNQILNRSSPQSIGIINDKNRIKNLWPKEICKDADINDSNYWFKDTIFVDKIININDSKTSKHESDRELRLKELFASIDIELQFIN